MRLMWEPLVPWAPWHGSGPVHSRRERGVTFSGLVGCACGSEEARPRSIVGVVPGRASLPASAQPPIWATV